MKTLWTQFGWSLGCVLGMTLMAMNGLQAQVHNGDLWVTTQVAADAFSYTEVTGNLYINNSDITNLNGLSELQTVGGNLYLAYNDLLINLDGLSSLTSIGGWFSLKYNPSMNDIGGLSSLSLIGSDFHIGYNDVLPNVNGLEALTYLGGYLRINENPILANLDGLSGLPAIGGYFYLAYNDGLVNLNGLSSLTTIGGWFSLKYNPSMNDIGGLSSLTSIGDDFHIGFNDVLPNVDGLEGLTSLAGYLSIDNNPVLSNIDGLSNLASIGTWLALKNNSALTNVDGLSSLQILPGDVNIQFNDALLNLDGLSSVTSILGYLGVGNNTALTDLDGLASLTSIGGNLGIIYNNSLTDIDGLSGLISVTGYLGINHNPLLTFCDGLFPLLCGRGVTGSITIANNGSGCTVSDILASAPCNPSSNIGLLNGDFEAGSGNMPNHWYQEGWKAQNGIFSWETGTGRNNSMTVSLEHVGSSNDTRWSQVVSGLIPGETYTLSGWIKGENIINETGTNGANLYTDIFYNLSPTFHGTFDWTYSEVSFVAPLNGEMKLGCRLGYYNSIVFGKAWFDDVRLEGPGLGSGFTLMNAYDNTEIGPIADGEIVDLTFLPTTKLNIRWDDAPVGTSSVKFGLNANPDYRVDNNLPFAMQGNSINPPYNYYQWTPTPGAYTMTVTPYSSQGAGGTAGTSETISFTVIESPETVTGFSLVDALNNVILGPLNHDDVIDLAAIGTHKLNIIAHTSPKDIGSVDFDLSGTGTFHQYDNQPPYCMAQDNQNGGYYQYLFSPGVYTLTATPYTQYAAGGDAGTPMTIGFTVVNSGARMAIPSEAFSVYPNPTTGKLNLQFFNVEGGKAIVEVFDQQGRMIQFQTLEVQPGTSERGIRVYDLAEGIYTMTCILERERFMKQFIKR